MIRKLDITDSKVSNEVLELQKKSYKIEAEIIGYNSIPPLLETLEELKKCKESFYGHYIITNLAGIISYKKEGQIIDIHRVAVHPEYFRMGIAQKLIEYIEAIYSNITKIVVSTAQENIPAVNLYEKLGYKKIKKIEVENNLIIVCLEKMLKG